MKRGLLKSWNQLAMDTTSLNKKVDAISGATYSSNAIINSVQTTLGNYLAIKHQGNNISWQTIASLVLTLILLVLSLVMVLKKKFRKFYWYYLIAVVLIFGLWLKQMISLESVHNWLINGLPWQSNIQIIAILILALAIALMRHENYYCNYLCPMGAVQMLVLKVSPFKKITLHLKIAQDLAITEKRE